MQALKIALEVLLVGEDQSENQIRLASGLKGEWRWYGSNIQKVCWQVDCFDAFGAHIFEARKHQCSDYCKLSSTLKFNRAQKLPKLAVSTVSMLVILSR